MKGSIDGLYLLPEEYDRHSYCPSVGRRLRRMRFTWALRADVWNPAWIGPQECWLHLTDRLVGTPAILESADTSIARISLVMNEGGRPEDYPVEERRWPRAPKHSR